MIRKTLIAAVATIVALVGLAPAAAAQDYPPDTPGISCAPTSPVAGEAFTCTATGFDGGTTVTFSWAPVSGAAFGLALVAQDSGSATATAAADGTASTSITINTPGTYSVTATGAVGGEQGSASTTITVQAATAAPGLPQTGGGNTSTLLAIAGGALLLGGLAVVGARARRQTKGATL